MCFPAFSIFWLIVRCGCAITALTLLPAEREMLYEQMEAFS